MLKEEELQSYQAKLVIPDEKKDICHQRDKITILLTEKHSIRTIAKISRL